jgi:cytochrome c556
MSTVKVEIVRHLGKGRTCTRHKAAIWQRVAVFHAANFLFAQRAAIALRAAALRCFGVKAAFTARAPMA